MSTGDELWADKGTSVELGREKGQVMGVAGLVEVENRTGEGRQTWQGR